jgi:hypothetical protein
MGQTVEDVNSECVVTTDAINKYRECLELIEQAHRWAQGEDIPWEQVGDHGQEIVRERRERVADMERSFYKSFMHLITVSQHHDGPLTINADAAPGSFFWHHKKSGYHGGLIFHRAWGNSGKDPMPYGTWSIHT